MIARYSSKEKRKCRHRYPPPGSRVYVVPSIVASNSFFEEFDTSVIEGDITHAPRAELASIFTPFHVVIGCAGMAGPAGTELKLARAILTANVGR